MINWLLFRFSLAVRAVQDLPTALTKHGSKHCNASKLLSTLTKKKYIYIFFNAK